MTTRLAKSKFALAGGTTALLIGLSASPALASSGFITHCSEATDKLSVTTIHEPSLNIQLADHGLIDAAADMKSPAAEPTDEKVTSPALAEATTKSSSEETTEETVDEKNVIPVNDPPGTALRLPGVSEKDQPRFRRQMNRTDI